MFTHKLVTVTFTVPVGLTAEETVLYMRAAVADGDYVQVDNPTFEQLGTTEQAAATIQR